MRAAAAALAIVWALLAAAPAAACGGADSPCAVDGGEYRIRMPDVMPANGGRVGAIFFFHGWRGSAKAEMANKTLGQTVSDLGVAFVAMEGEGKTWSFPRSPSSYRDEFAYVEKVVADVVDRFPIDPDRLMASGFSMGGSMVWYLASRMPDRFAGFAPIAGAFWRPQPAACDGKGPPPILMHVHGTADKVVPMAGRPIRDVYYQGDVYRGLNLWLGRFPQRPPARRYDQNGLRCEEWGARIELCLHSGGHSMRAEWIARAWTRLAAKRGWTD